jgi:hypothetical protein
MAGGCAFGAGYCTADAVAVSVSCHVMNECCSGPIKGSAVQCCYVTTAEPRLWDRLGVVRTRSARDHPPHAARLPVVRSHVPQISSWLREALALKAQAQTAAKAAAAPAVAAAGRDAGGVSMASATAESAAAPRPSPF